MSELGNDRYAEHQPLYQLVEDISEGVVLLDLDGRLRWANPAALAMHEVASIEELGADVDSYRQRFELYYRNHHEIGEGRSPMERLLEGEPFEDVILKVVPAAEEVASHVHRARGKFLHREGRPDAIALIIEDITELLDAEDRFERSFNANPAPALICRLDSQRFTRANQGFLDMVGMRREAVVTRSIYELDVFAHSPQRESSIRRLCEGQSIPQTEAMLHTGTGGDKAVIVAGQPIEIDAASCMLLTFTDLEPARQAQNALRQSEALFSTAFQMSPAPIALAYADTLSLIEVNEAFRNVLAQRDASREATHLEDYRLFSAQTCRHLMTELQLHGRVRDLEARADTESGEPLVGLISADTVTINTRDCLLLSLVDISERKRYETELFSAIETVMKDASWFTQTLVEKLANVRQTSISPSLTSRTTLADLSTRERDVLALICQGLSDKRIAARLELAHSTVRNYVASLYQKLDVHSRGEAIVWARQRGFHGTAAR